MMTPTAGTWRWAMSSERGAVHVLWVLLALVLQAEPLLGLERQGIASPTAPSSSGGGGKVFLTLDEALELAFPKCIVARKTAFLDEKQEQRVGELVGEETPGRVLTYYEARRKRPDGKPGALVGTAYFDGHRVRTKRETLMIVIDPADRIARIEVLAFGEPLDYLPRAKWYAQLVGHKLDGELRLGRGVRNVTGATLSARAAVAAARRALARHQVLREAEEAARRRREAGKADGTRGRSERSGQSQEHGAGGGEKVQKDGEETATAGQQARTSASLPRNMPVPSGAEVWLD